MSSAERLRVALEAERPHGTPCCVMNWQALRRACGDDWEFYERQLEMGLDVRVELPDVEWRMEADLVRVSQLPQSERGAAIGRQYRTADGALTAIVRRTSDWPFGDETPLFEDFLAPRSQKYLVTGPADLPALRCLLPEPRSDDLLTYREAAAVYRRFAEHHGLLLQGGWRDYTNHDVATFGTQSGGFVGIDALMWLCGPTAPLEWAYDEPEFLAELIEVISRWARRRVEIVLDAARPELVVKRAWYEGTELWSPLLYRRFILPVLKEDAALVHAAGAKLGYINTSGTWPIFDTLLEAGVDVLLGVDPVQGQGTDLAAFAKKAAGRMCLWGGVSAPMQIEAPAATPETAREAVETAMAACAGHGGFILSPVDNLMADTAHARRNLLAFIDAWKGHNDAP